MSFEDMIEHTCDKCGMLIFPKESVKNHIKECKSTNIKDMVDKISSEIDQKILEDLLKNGCI